MTDEMAVRCAMCREMDRDCEHDRLPFAYDSAPTVNVTTRRACAAIGPVDGSRCDLRAGHRGPHSGQYVTWPKDPVRARRGKTARNRGNGYEREVAAKLGGRRVGQYGDSVDVDVPGYLRVQCKNGGAYPERLDRWLRAIPVEAGLLRAVVLGDAPGPGNRRRSLIVFDLDEYAMWHGRKP